MNQENDEEYGKFNKMHWGLMLIQLAIIVLSGSVFLLLWQNFEVPCVR
jgi:hypothetical protein